MTGKSGTGKSYLSNILAEKHGYKILELDAVVKAVAKKQLLSVLVLKEQSLTLRIRSTLHSAKEAANMCELYLDD